MLKLYNLGTAGWTVSWLEREFYSRAVFRGSTHLIWHFYYKAQGANQM